MPRRRRRRTRRWGSATDEAPSQAAAHHLSNFIDNGINIIENYYLEELAEARVYEFVLVVPPLKVRGGTGSALRSFALVPRQEG
jgi:kynurenine formamidase